MEKSIRYYFTSSLLASIWQLVKETIKVRYQPKYQISNEIIKYLARIDAAKMIVDDLSVPLTLQNEFRKEATARMSHYSTKIEGNRLTLKQTKDLLSGKEVIAREIDKREVMNYYDCLEWIAQTSRARKSITEKDIKNIHGIIEKGILKGKLRGEYREAQNAIYDSRTRKPVYFPPEAKLVPGLMTEFIEWLNHEKTLHPLLKAGIAHYRFVVIHPFMDGNGRTARALATLLLYQSGYDLKQFYSLEEYYAEDLMGYYRAIQKPHALHYDDAPDPDITEWILYFVKGAAIIFEDLKEKVLKAAQGGSLSESRSDRKLLETIGPRERKLLQYFKKSVQLRRKNLCTLFQIKDRAAGNLIQKWVHLGVIIRQGSGYRDAYYVLASDYQKLLD